MKVWNGWGEEGATYHVNENARRFLENKIQASKEPTDITLEEMMKRVGNSRISNHPLITTDKIERIRHSVGQSLSDWIAIRSGENIKFPDGVAFPEDEQDVREIISYAKEIGANLIPYGGGSSVVGHLTITNDEQPNITVDMRRMNKLLHLDKKGGIATFQTGIRGPEVEASLRANGFTLGHFPQSFEFSTLGGWIVTRSSGQFSLYYGRMDQLFLGGSLESPNGRIEMPPFPASAAGPELRQVILGSEGRLGILTKGIVHVSPLPEVERFHSVFFRNQEDGINSVRQMAQSKLPLAMMRLSLTKETHTTLHQAGQGVALHLLQRYLSLRGANDQKVMLIYGAVGNKKDVEFSLSQALEIIKNNKGIYIGSSIGKLWYKDRFRLPYVRNSLWKLGYAVDTLETAITWDKVSEAISSIESSISSALDSLNEKVHVFTHLSHIYPHGSSIYVTYLFRIAASPEETYFRWKIIKGAASNAIVKAGGTISHQHGVGLDHIPYLQAEKGNLGIELMKNISLTLDPTGLMNPGKLFR